MTAETVLNNARIVLADEIVEGSIVLRDGLIAGIDAGTGRTGEDMGGDFIIPGLVELHTDHLEGHYAPRPKVRWNPIAAVLAHDAQVATAGITTVLDALRVGMDEDADLTSQDIAQAGRRDRGQRSAGSAASRPLHSSALRGFGAGLPQRLRELRR